MTEAIQEKVDRFFANFPMRSYPKGQILIFADENPDHVFYLMQGRVRKYDISYRGDEIIVNVFQYPAFFPMSWATTHVHNDYFYAAETPITVHVAPPEKVVSFIRANPDVMYDLLSRVYSGTEGILGRVVQLMAGTAHSRLVYELVIETKRFGEKRLDGAYVLNLSEADLAARTGMSRETVSREFSKLARESLVEGHRSGIVIQNLDALAAKLT